MSVENMLILKIAESIVMLEQLTTAIDASTSELNRIVNHLNQKDEN